MILFNYYLPLLFSLVNRYNSQTIPYYAASRIWVDGIINPLDTRKWISMGIEAANHKPSKKKYCLGKRILIINQNVIHQNDCQCHPMELDTLLTYY